MHVAVLSTPVLTTVTVIVRLQFAVPAVDRAEPPAAAAADKAPVRTSPARTAAAHSAAPPGTRGLCLQNTNSLKGYPKRYWDVSLLLY